MCKLKVIRKTANGLLLFCVKSETFQLSFKNILLSLDRNELHAFTNYISTINCNYWEEEYRSSIYCKKIPLPSTQKNLILLFSSDEIEEIKVILGLTNLSFLHSDTIDYKSMLN